MSKTNGNVFKSLDDAITGLVGMPREIRVAGSPVPSIATISRFIDGCRNGKTQH